MTYANILLLKIIATKNISDDDLNFYTSSGSNWRKAMTKASW